MIIITNIKDKDYKCNLVRFLFAPLCFFNLLLTDKMIYALINFYVGEKFDQGIMILIEN